MENILKWFRHYLSPVFVAMLMASFVLWYIAKLNHTYTTEQTISVNIDGDKFRVVCVVEGVGTNLFGYRAYMDKTLHIPLSELNYKKSHEPGREGYLILEPQSLQNAISVRYSDIKVLSIGRVPEIPILTSND
ncbi:MAG: hypothetical protein RR330_05730 [Alistipes sp.]